MPNSREGLLTNGLRVKRAPSVSVSNPAGVEPGPPDNFPKGLASTGEILYNKRVA